MNRSKNFLTCEKGIYPVSEITSPGFRGITGGAEGRNFSLPQSDPPSHRVDGSQRMRIFWIGFPVQKPSAVGNPSNGHVTKVKLVVKERFDRVQIQNDSGASRAASGEKKGGGVGESRGKKVQDDLSNHGGSHETETGSSGRPRPRPAPRIARAVRNEHVVRVPPERIFFRIRR